MKKSVKILIASATTFVLLAAVVLMVLFIPIQGKRNDYMWSQGDEYNLDNIATVEKKPNEDFKILLLADIQLWTNSADNKAAKAMITELVEKTKPDLIATVGDNVSGISTNTLMKGLVKFMDGFKIPWTVVFGNHDSELKSTVNYLGDLMEDSEYSLFSKGPSNLYGCGNYVVNIKEGDKYLQQLIMFDNGRYTNYKGIGRKEMYLGYEQQAWYKWNIKGMEKKLGYTVPSMTFQHFSLPEFRTAIKELCPKNNDGLYVVPENLGFGSCQYLPGVPPVNSGFFDLAKELGSTHSMFFGHDHENDASIMYEGIRMTFGLKTGPSPRPWNDATRYGATTITIDSDNKTTVEHVVMKNL